jgi:hypothetical protein
MRDLGDIRTLKKERAELRKRLLSLDNAIKKQEHKRRQERQGRSVGRPRLKYDYARAVRAGVQAKRVASPGLSDTAARHAYARDHGLSYKYIQDLHLWTAEKMRRHVEEFLVPGKDEPDLQMDLHVAQWRWLNHVEQIRQRPHR